MCLWLLCLGLRVCGCVFVVVCCGRGPAGNAGRGWSWLRSGGGGRGGEGEEGGRGADRWVSPPKEWWPFTVKVSMLPFYE